MKTSDSTLAGRYAAAYMPRPGAAGAEKEAAARLDALVRLEKAAAPAMPLLLRPLVPAAVKLDVLLRACPGGEPARPLALAAELVKAGRLGLLGEIRSRCALLADEAAGRLRARVLSRYPLPAAGLAALEKALSAVSGRRVSASAEVSEAVIGGFEASFGGFLLDATVSGRLARLRGKLVRR